MNLKKFGLGLLALVVMSSTLFSAVPAQAATFNPNLIMDDSVMDNYNSMNAAQIDSFLNGFPNSCISTNNGFSAIDPTGYNSTNGYLYGGNVSAGTVIADAARAYEMNPEVILTTLQKEQSLVKGDAGCATNRYVKALGYGCPDGGSSYDYSGLNLYTKNGVTYTSATGVCVNEASKAGFSQQVIHAAWMLKYSEQRSRGNIGWAIVKGNWNNSDDLNATYSGYMTQGCYKRSKYETTCTNYDGYAPIDGTTVHLDSGTTAALYRYTPHLSGNQNFFSIFTNWFGATIGPDYAALFSSFNLYSDSAHTALLPRVGPANKYVLSPGQTVYALVGVQNIGRATWDSNTHLGTANPRDHSSPFVNTDWLAPQRAAAMGVSSLVPNGSSNFSFTMKAPTSAGSYTEAFGVVDDGKVWTDAINILNIDVSTTASQPVGYTANILDSANNNTLSAGNTVISPDGYSTLSLSIQGELTLRDDFQKTWSPNVSAGPGSKLIMQPDGNLVLYDKYFNPVWNTQTDGNGSSKLYVQEDGNLALYNSTGPIWSTGTNLPLLHYNYTQGFLAKTSILYQGQKAETADRKYKLILQGDGNLVLYDLNMHPLWATYTLGNNAAYLLAMQGDGNLVLYTKDMRPVWSTSTNLSGGSVFYTQQDGNLVIYNSAGKPVWSSGTNR